MALRAVDVTRDFGGVHAVAGVTIEVRRGTLTGLIGPNGAGKSTLLALLAGTLPVTSGQVIYGGADVTGGPAYRRARMGLVRTFQLASEFKRLTVMENLLSVVPVNRGDSLAGALRRRRGTHRRAAGPGRTRHLRLHLRARRRPGADGRHPGAPFRELGVHRVLLRRRPPDAEISRLARPMNQFRNSLHTESNVTR